MFMRVTAELLGGPLCGNTVSVGPLTNGVMPAHLTCGQGKYLLVTKAHWWMNGQPHTPTYCWGGIADGPNAPHAALVA